MKQACRIEIKNLKRYFGKTKAVDDISFKFDSGQIFGFIGQNGAGKTTTLRILATLDEASSGDVLIDGISVAEEPEAIRRVVGFVPDKLPCHNDMTVNEYLDFFARAYGLKGKIRAKKVAEVKEFTNVKNFENRLVNNLSKGMLQRLSLGRALIHDPDILLMDEPAAGLDPRARVELRELILTLAKQGKAILISSHILTELTMICNGIVIIEHGKILETGTIDDLLGKNAAKHTVAINILKRTDNICQDLLTLPNVTNAHFVDEEIFLDISGTEETCSEVLSEIVKRKYKLTEFRQVKTNLEDIFMNVTDSEVR